MLADSGETQGRNMLTGLASDDLEFVVCVCVVCVSYEPDRMSKEMGGVWMAAQQLEFLDPVS